MKTLILFSNLNYLRGIEGRFDSYLNSIKYILNQKTNSKALNSLNKLIKKEKPDLSCLIETRESQITKLDGKTKSYTCKYSGMLKHMPFHKKNGAGFAANSKVTHKVHKIS